MAVKKTSSGKVDKRPQGCQDFRPNHLDAEAHSFDNVDKRSKEAGELRQRVAGNAILEIENRTGVYRWSFPNNADIQSVLAKISPIRKQDIRATNAQIL